MTAASLAFVKKTNSFKGFINVLGIIEKYIIIHIEDSSEYFEKKYNKNYSEVILVCKKTKLIEIISFKNILWRILNKDN
jgi:hypothetical protein